MERVPEAKEGFEPKKNGKNEPELPQLYAKNPLVLRAMNKVQTWIRENCEYFWVPDFRDISL